MEYELNKPGEKVERSGIYTVMHEYDHVREHDITVIYGDKFPPCNHCGEHPRFKLVHAAIYVSAHEQFKAK